MYSISTVADLLGVGIQTLRLYEHKGLLTPNRTDGGTRRYSQDDLDRLHHITELVTAGINLPGIAHILELEEQNHQLRQHRSAK